MLVIKLVRHSFICIVYNLIVIYPLYRLAYSWWNSMTASIPFRKISNEQFSFGEWIAFDSSPNPINTVLIPNTCSKVELMGILQPRSTANGFLPKAISRPFRARTPGSLHGVPPTAFSRKRSRNLSLLPDRQEVKSGTHILVPRAWESLLPVLYQARY